MKKVCLLLSHSKWMAGLEKLSKRLIEAGVNCEIRLVEEGYITEEETLYLTDSVKMFSLLEKEGVPLLVYLHEENKSEDFSKGKYACEEPGELEPEYLERVYRRFKGMPWMILETKRCIVRESVEEDVEAFCKIYAEPLVTEYMENLQESRVGERAYIKEYIEKVYNYYEFGVWTVILKETGEIIGRAGLSIREGYDLPDLGYVIGVPWQGQGLATEVCQGILQYAKEEFGFDRVQALIRPENRASIGVAVRLGFKQQGECYEKGQNFGFFVRSV